MYTDTRKFNLKYNISIWIDYQKMFSGQDKSQITERLVEIVNETLSESDFPVIEVKDDGRSN